MDDYLMTCLIKFLYLSVPKAPYMESPENIDLLFREAVAAIDAGDVNTLDRLLTAHPWLVGERLTHPGAWLRDKIGKALDGFFRQPYLLWFVAEDPVLHGRLPANIAEVAGRIIEKARREEVPSLQEQLDYTLLLVGWSRIAQDGGVQIALIDVLIDAGATPNGVPNNALVNGHLAAAEHLIRRGAPLTLASALCLGYWEAVPALAQTASKEQRQFSLILTALNGRAEALTKLIGYGVDINARCGDLYPHGSALHHAASSGSLEAVKVLVEAGADLNDKDTLWNGTPLGWAEYGEKTAVADYLRGQSERQRSS
jgi:hypothetical protein